MNHGLNHGLSDGTVQKLVAVFIKFPEIDQAVLYGSRAKGNYKPGSDIDLSLRGVKLTHAICASIADAIDELLLPYTVDLSQFDALDASGSADLRQHIERVGLVFYQRARSP